MPILLRAIRNGMARLFRQDGLLTALFLSLHVAVFNVFDIVGTESDGKSNGCSLGFTIVAAWSLDTSITPRMS